MVNIVSPGVYVIEKDISNYPATIDSTTVGVVGFADKGPTNEATLITSQERLVDIFGDPSEAVPGQGIVGSLEILEATNRLYYVRVASDSAKQASATIPLGVCPAVAVSACNLGKGKAVTIKLKVRDHLGVSGYDYEKTYSIPATGYDSQFNALAGIFGTDLDGLKVAAAFPFTTDPNGVKTPTATDNNKINGYIVGSAAGSGAALYVSASDAIFLPLDKSGATDGSTASLVKEITVSGATIAVSDTNYLVETLYPGKGYNLGTTPDGAVSGNSIEVDPKGGPSFVVTLNDKGSTKESFKVSFLTQKNFLTDTINISEDNKVSDYIQGNMTEGGSKVNIDSIGSFAGQASEILTAATVDMVSGTSTQADANPRFIKLVQGTYALAGGDSGAPTSPAYIPEIIGDPAKKTGLYALDDDLLNLTVAVIPGLNDQAIQNALITLAETSQNFIACVSPPYQAQDSVQEAIDWSNGFSDERTAAINSSYAAIYWPWVKTFIPSLEEDRWLDPAIYGARQIAYTAAVSELWFAPAGFVRGRLTKPSQTQVALNQGDRDSLYSGGNAINPIVNFPQQGITIFGQRTSQRDPTALDRVNVRMLMIYIRKVLLLSTQRFAFEPNDSILWDKIEATVNPLLDDIKRRRGITEFAVICDETVNTPLRVDRNEVWCKILLKPTKAAEAVVFEVNVTSQSAKISG